MVELENHSYLLEDEKFLSKYNLHEFINKGGFGMVFRCTIKKDREQGKNCAIKIIKAETFEKFQ